MMMHSPNYFTVPLKAFHEITSKVLQTNFMKEKVSKSSFVSIKYQSSGLNIRARKAPNTKLECVGLLFCAQILLRSKKARIGVATLRLILLKQSSLVQNQYLFSLRAFFKFQVLKIETHLSLKQKLFNFQSFNLCLRLKYSELFNINGLYIAQRKYALM